MADDERIAALQRELDLLKRALPVTEDQRVAMDRRAKEWQNEMHQMREARMAHAAPFTRADYAAFEAATPRSVCQDIAARGGVRPPSADGTAGTISVVHRSPGVYPNTNGWRSETPFGPQPGINHVDRLVDAQDARDRAELILQEARTAAVRKALSEAK